MSFTGETDQLIKRAQEIRDREHRLKPEFRLKTVTEMVEFVHAQGLVSTLGGNELPSLISAVLGRPWKPSAKGFAGWNDWWALRIEGMQLPRVFGEIERREDILASRIFRRSKTLVSDRLWPILDPIVERHETLLTKGKTLSRLEFNLMKTIKAEGSIRTDHLRNKLKLEHRKNNYRFHRSLANLEIYGLIAGAEDAHPERHLHANIWQTWEKRVNRQAISSGFSYSEALSKFLEKCIDACILAREDQISRWFEWEESLKPTAEALLNDGAVLRAGSYLISSKNRGA